MLLRYFNRLLSPKTAAADKAPQEWFDEAAELRGKGDVRGSLKVLRRILDVEPANVGALNDYAACLSDIGDVQAANDTFELAYALDDTFLPAMANHARVLVDNKRGAEAMPYLVRAKVSAPDMLHVDSVYAALCMANGDVDRALSHQLRAWCANFDSLRHANAYLFWSCYADLPEERLAAEHRFWASTVAPTPDSASAAEPREQGADETAPQPALFAEDGTLRRRMRIGYLSPDLRSHSVRFFFGPLLNGHDRSAVETFVYHDFPGKDVQTTKLEGMSEHFHDVHSLSDAELRNLIRSHGLDVLVELAGHTSHNRMSLLQDRLADLQVTGIGYPPTTGLQSVDFKLLDSHVLTDQPERFYAEAPLALPTSFWCFDPLEEVPEPVPPPCERNGYVTFGSVGNIAKITNRMLQSWSEILDEVKGSRLLIRSITFTDPMSENAMRERLRNAGLPMDRVDLRKPESGAALYESYGEIDVMLDTFPFNGGTTTCICTYMGVPVVSLEGESLLSRMGRSVLANLGAADFVVQDEHSYVRRAIDLARDLPCQRRFRAGARARYAGTALGNGRLFAAEFEQACESALRARPADDPPAWRSEIPVLPAREITRRAYWAAQRGQLKGAARILDHCLREYPNDGPAHLLRMQLMVWDRRYDEALAYLRRETPAMAPADRFSAALAAARVHVLLGRHAQAREELDAVDASWATDPFDRMQERLFRCALADDEHAAASLPSTQAPGPQRRFTVVVPCDEPARFDAVERQVREACAGASGWRLDIQRCAQHDRVRAYQDALGAPDADIVLLLQKNASPLGPGLPGRVARALEGADLVSFAGARRWVRMDWRLDDFAQKAGGVVQPSTERQGVWELHLAGPGRTAQADGMALLEGALLACRAQAVRDVEFDEELHGAATLLEEAWTHEVYQRGGRLRVHRALGVLVDPAIELDAGNRTEARVRWATLMGFDPFAAQTDDATALSIPMPSAEQALAVARRYLDGDD
ncbi:O-linked N-acetylglucosamine transferase family protein [Ramlibacter humi]|uniref:O-GlcNAc transferase C-terminal domain-containing protein n=1 Tax=Ramlibacter humi TaxID=2530451 RepID=A0A4Z0BRM9_9BURK|nr:hypothetical protein [Ramlibacter humi]TFZ01977.1 hypothetical protein EZ216_12405 [Ramlibacter humi]